MKYLKNILVLTLVCMLVACGGKKDVPTNNNTNATENITTDADTKSAENTSAKPIEVYKSIVAEVEKLGLKSKKVNLTSDDKILQLIFSDPNNKITTATIQINYCEKPYLCAKATNLKDFTNTYKDRGAAVSEQSGIYDSDIKEIQIGDKAVYLNLSHQKKKPTHNSYRANYMEGKYMVEVFIGGKYEAMTDDYQAEQELGKAILELALKVKAE